MNILISSACINLYDPHVNTFKYNLSHKCDKYDKYDLHELFE